MHVDTSRNAALGLTLSLTLAVAAGCADGWACGRGASGRGCFCTSEEVHTTETSECNASQTGAPHCCDDLVADTCSCPPAPSCWMDLDACVCGLNRPSGAASTERCAAEPGSVCCIDDVLSTCTCGFTECPLSEQRMVGSCDPTDIELCDDDELRVSDCLTRQ